MPSCEKLYTYGTSSWGGCMSFLLGSAGVILIALQKDTKNDSTRRELLLLCWCWLSSFINKESEGDIIQQESEEDIIQE